MSKRPHPEDIVVILTINPEYENMWDKLPKVEFEALRDSIRENGLFEKLVLNQDNVLLDGHNRRDALHALGIPVTEDLVERKHFDNVLDEKIFIMLVNLQRRHLNDYQKTEKAKPLEDLYTEKAIQRQLNGTLSSIEDKGRAGELTAKVIGVSKATYERAKKIRDEGTEDEKNEARSKKRMVSKVYNKIMKRQKLEKAKEAGSPPLPLGKYDIILADPPWQYGYEGSQRGKADIHYATLPTQKICDLEVPSAENAMLFLWVTNPMIPDGLRVLKSWGFEYKTNYVWVKDKIGTGFYNRSKHELLFICRKGDFTHPTDADRLPSVIEAPRRAHSEKPEVVYDMIEALYPRRAYLELYARPKTKREGWTMWGLET